MVDPRYDLADQEPAGASADENIFQVLAAHARTRTTHDLRATSIGCAISAVLLWVQHPALSWLAAGFAATAGYGVWGLLDRAAESKLDAGARSQLAGLRDLTALLGTAAALWALLGFMAAAFGNWHH